MSKLVDSFRIADESGGGKKEIVFNLGDITAREWADEAKSIAYDASNIANMALTLAQSSKGPTYDRNINRVILSCATMDSNTYPIVLPEHAGFVLYLGYDENHKLTDIEIESNTGELHTLHDGYNSIFWNDYGVVMDIYMDFGVLENGFVYAEDVESTYFTFVPEVTASEVSIALMRLFCLIHENNGSVNEALDIAYNALDAANEANSASASLTTVDNVNRVILACASFGYYYEGGAYHSDDKPKKIPENVEFRLEPRYNEDNTLKELQLYIYKDGRWNSAGVLYEGYNDEFLGHIEVNLKMYIDFGVVEKGIIAGEDITQAFKFTDATVSETSVALMRLFSMANDAKSSTETAISMTDESYYKGLAINDLLINRLTNNNSAVPGIISKKIGEKYYKIDYEPISDSEVPVLLYDTSHVIMLNCSNLTTLNGLVSNGNNKSADDIKEVTGIFAYEHLTGDALKLAFYSCDGIEKVQFTPNEVAMAVGSMDSMLASCKKLKYFNFEQMKFSSVNTCEFMFASAGLNSIVFPVLPGVKSLNYAFHMSKELITLDMSNVDCSTLTKFTVFGGGEYNLVNFTGLKNIKRSYAIKGSSKLSHESALNCIAGLYDLTEGGTITDYTAQTLEFHPDVTALLTEEEIAEATAKGWNIA